MALSAAWRQRHPELPELAGARQSMTVKDATGVRKGPHRCPIVPLRNYDAMQVAEEEELPSNRLHFPAWLIALVWNGFSRRSQQQPNILTLRYPDRCPPDDDPRVQVPLGVSLAGWVLLASSNMSRVHLDAVWTRVLRPILLTSSCAIVLRRLGCWSQVGPWQGKRGWPR
jgi:hypothetical protein